MTKKKLLSVVLVLAMCLGMLPTWAMAAVTPLDNTHFAVSTVTGKITALPSTYTEATEEAAADLGANRVAVYKVSTTAANPTYDGTTDIYRTKLLKLEAALTDINGETDSTKKTYSAAVSALRAAGGEVVDTSANSTYRVSSADAGYTLVAVEYVNAGGDDSFVAYAKKDLSEFASNLGVTVTPLSSITKDSTGNATVTVTGNGSGTLYYQVVTDENTAKPLFAKLNMFYADNDDDWEKVPADGVIDVTFENADTDFVVVTEVDSAGTFAKIGAAEIVTDDFNYSRLSVTVNSETSTTIAAKDASATISLAGCTKDGDTAAAQMSDDEKAAVYDLYWDDVKVLSDNLSGGAGSVTLNASAGTLTVNGKTADVDCGLDKTHTVRVESAAFARGSSAKVTFTTTEMPKLTTLKFKGVAATGLSGNSGHAASATYSAVDFSVNVSYAQAQTSAVLGEGTAEVNKQVEGTVTVKMIGSTAPSGKFSAIFDKATVSGTETTRLVADDYYFIVKEDAPAGAKNSDGGSIASVYYVAKVTVGGAVDSNVADFTSIKVKNTDITLKDGSVVAKTDTVITKLMTTTGSAGSYVYSADATAFITEKNVSVGKAADPETYIFDSMTSDGKTNGYIAYLYTEAQWKDIPAKYETATVADLLTSAYNGTALNTESTNLKALPNAKVGAKYYIVAHPNASAENAKYYVICVTLTKTGSATVATSYDTVGSTSRSAYLAGQEVKIAVTGALGEDGKPYNGDVSFKITASNAYSSTTGTALNTIFNGTKTSAGVVYDSTSSATAYKDAKVTLTKGVGTIVIPADRIRVIGNSSLTFVSDEIATINGSALTINVVNGPAAKIVAKPSGTDSLGIKDDEVNDGAAISATGNANKITVIVTDACGNPYIIDPATNGPVSATKKVVATAQAGNWTLGGQGTGDAEDAIDTNNGEVSFGALTANNGSETEATEATIRYTFDNSKEVYLDETFTIYASESGTAVATLKTSGKITADAAANGTYKIEISEAYSGTGVASQLTSNTAAYIQVKRGDYYVLSVGDFSIGAKATINLNDTVSMTAVYDASTHEDVKAKVSNPFLLAGNEPITVSIYDYETSVNTLVDKLKNNTAKPLISDITYKLNTSSTTLQNLPVTVSAGVAASLKYTETGAPVGPAVGDSRGAALQTQPSVQLVDGLNNPVSKSGVVVYVTRDTSSGSWTLLNADGTEVEAPDASGAATTAGKVVASATTDRNGVATFTGLKAKATTAVSTAALTFYMTADDGSVSVNSGTTSDTFTVPAPGEADKSTANIAVNIDGIKTNRGTDGVVTVAANEDGQSITINVSNAIDANGNQFKITDTAPVTVKDSLDDKVTVTGGGNIVFATDTAGNVTGTFVVTGITSTGVHELTVTSTKIAVLTPNPITFTVVGGDAKKLGGVKTLTADNTVGILDDFTVEVLDGAGNLVESDNSSVVTLELPLSAKGTLALAGEGVTNGVASATVENGVATFSGLKVTNLTQASQGSKLIASSGSLTPYEFSLVVPIQKGDPSDYTVDETVNATGTIESADNIGENTEILNVNASTRDDATLGGNVVEAVQDNGVETTISLKDGDVTMAARSIGDVLSNPENANIVKGDGTDTVTISAVKTTVAEDEFEESLAEAVKENPLLKESVQGAAYDVTMKVNGEKAAVANLRDDLTLVFPFNGNADEVVGMMKIEDDGTVVAMIEGIDYEIEDGKLYIYTDGLTKFVLLVEDPAGKIPEFILDECTFADNGKNGIGSLAIKNGAESGYYAFVNSSKTLSDGSSSVMATETPTAETYPVLVPTGCDSVQVMIVKGFQAIDDAGAISENLVDAIDLTELGE